MRQVELNCFTMYGPRNYVEVELFKWEMVRETHQTQHQSYEINGVRISTNLQQVLYMHN